MSLLNKPKRTLSNLSVEDFSKAKQICRTSFKEYKHKFHYEPDWDAFYNKNKMITNYEKKKKSEAERILFNTHSYSLQSNRNNNALNKQTSNDNLKRQRPQTSNLLSKKAPKTRQEGVKTSKNLSQLFQNEHLSSTLQTSESNAMKNQVFHSQNIHWRAPSQGLDRTSVSSKKFISKTKITDFSDGTSRQVHSIARDEKQQTISTILSKKENFYNPYSIGPKIMNRKPIKPIKTLRNQSIRQLKQFCQEERNMNFSQKLSQKQNNQVKSVNKFEQNREGTFFCRNKKISRNEKQDILKSSKIREAKLEKKMRNRIFSKGKQLKRTPVVKYAFFLVDQYGHNLK